MISCGLSVKTTDIVIVLLTVLLTAMNLILAHYINITYILIIDALIYAILIICIKTVNLHNTQKEQKQATPERLHISVKQKESLG
jgi:prepilin signal peptidase PulO-like enzyme (type II secretory pathway)